MNQYNTIYFDDPTHRYWDDVQTQYTSTTTFLKCIEKPFDEDYWSSYKAVEKVLLTKEKNKKLWFQLKKLLFEDDSLKQTRIANFVKNSKFHNEILDEKDKIKLTWTKISDEGKSKGTRIHKYKEDKQFDLLEEIGIVRIQEGSGYKKSMPLSELRYNVWYPEVLVANRQLKISGMIDMLMLTVHPITGKTVINIDDWKTNKKIDIENRWQSFLSPVSHLDDCNYNKYRLQLSMYAYLAQCELGEDVDFGIVQFTHLIELPKVVHSKEPVRYEERIFKFKPLIKEIKDIIKSTGRTL